MKHSTLIIALALATASASFAHAQQSTRTLPTLHSPAPRGPVTQLVERYTALPYKGGTPDQYLMMQAGAGSTLPLWKGSATVGAKTFKYKMVGKDPAQGNSPNIPTVIIPIKLVFVSFSNASFDPTANDPTCSPNGTPLQLALNSPIFNNIKIKNLGTGQYTSLFQRGNYFTINPNYVVKLAPVTTLPLKTINVSGGALFNVPCGNGKLAGLDISVWDNFVQGTLMPQIAGQGVGPTMFPIFLFYNVVMFDGSPNNCCILGYHSAMNNPSFGGAFQTYSTSGYDGSGAFSGDVATLSHEVAEWLADPDIKNPTPPWGHIGQVSGCQNNLEVGDPLSGTVKVFTLGGMNYHLQDEAFTSWFYPGSPVTTFNGKFSLFGTLKVDAKRCH